MTSRIRLDARPHRRIELGSAAPLVRYGAGEVRYGLEAGALSPTRYSIGKGSELMPSELYTFGMADSLGYPTPVLRVASDATSAWATRYFAAVIEAPGVWSLDSLRYAAARGGDATPRGIEVDTSVNDFASYLPGGGHITTKRPDLSTYSIDTSSLTGLTGPLEIRFHPYAPNTGSTVEVGWIEMTLTAAPA
ncbi:hypothetical protein [Kineococcus esterisolvens]|uniref:hypothetical protein n=1 Tax=unclassified Kineococcus TaxID=2621656 RepID=UPI003D7E8E53